MTPITNVMQRNIIENVQIVVTKITLNLLNKGVKLLLSIYYMFFFELRINML